MRVDSLTGAVALIVAGAVLALNFGGSARRMAASYRRLPVWLRWSVATSTTEARIWGLLTIALGAVLLVIAFRGE